MKENGSCGFYTESMCACKSCEAKDRCGWRAKLFTAPSAHARRTSSVERRASSVKCQASSLSTSQPGALPSGLHLKRRAWCSAKHDGVDAIETIFQLLCTLLRAYRYPRTSYESMSKSQRETVPGGLSWKALVSQLSVWTRSVLGKR